MGNFSKCQIGMRNQIQIQVLRERYADTGELALIAMMRVDVALTHPESFHKISGITPQTMGGAGHIGRPSLRRPGL